jgi:hypothetical protein
MWPWWPIEGVHRARHQRREHRDYYEYHGLREHHGQAFEIGKGIFASDVVEECDVTQKVFGNDFLWSLIKM